MRKDREFTRECWVVIWGLVGVVVGFVVVVVKMINYGVVRDIKGQICRRTVTLSSVTLNFELKKVVLSSCLARLLLVPVHFIEREHQ